MITTVSVIALVAVVLLWVGLSPRVALPLYEGKLMPRSDMPKVPISGATETRVTFLWNELELHGILYQVANQQRVILYCGGRGSSFGSLMNAVQDLVNEGMSVFVYEPPGFGSATGRASLKGLVGAAMAAYEQLLSMKYDGASIIIYGQSLGSGAASYVSHLRPSVALILQSAFSSLERVIKEMLPLLKIYPTWMFPQPHLDSAASLKEGHPPLLIIHGDADTTINVAHAYRLADAAGSGTTLVIVPGAEHSNLIGRPEWFQAVRKLLDSLPSRKAPSVQSETAAFRRLADTSAQSFRMLSSWAGNKSQ